MAYTKGKKGTIEWTSGSFKFKIEWSEEYDAALNTSIIGTQMYIYSSSFGGYWCPNGTITVNGETVVTMDYYDPATHRTSGDIQGAWREFVSYSSAGAGEAPPWKSSPISHNSDGSKSITITSNVTSIYGQSLGSSKQIETKSQSIELTTIQNSTGSITAADVTLGNACAIRWTPSSASYRYKLKFSLGDWSYTTDVIHPNKTTLFTYGAYTIPKDVANQLPNATQGTMKATLTAYSDEAATKQVGSSVEKTFTVTVPSDIVPTITSVTASIDNSAYSNIASWGIAVAGFSKVKIVAEADGSYGSTIKSYTISGVYSATKDGASLSYTGGSINSSGDKTFTVTCKDSRGRSSQAKSTNSISFYSYSRPEVTTFLVDKGSSSATIKADWVYSSLGGKNSVTAKLQYKKRSASSWTNYSGEVKKNTQFSVSLSNASDYDFQLVVTDALSSYSQGGGGSSGGGGGTSSSTTPTITSVLLDFKSGGKGLGLGRTCSSDSFEVGLPALFYGAVDLQGNVSISGGVTISGQSLDNYIKDIIETVLEQKGLLSNGDGT